MEGKNPCRPQEYIKLQIHKLVDQGSPETEAEF